MSYDSSVWYPVGVSGSQSWQFVTNFGWRGQTESFIGYVTYKVTQVSCRDPETGERFYQLNYSNWVYHDEFGVAHSYALSVSDQECGISIPYSASATATDGSGYILYASANPSATVIPRGGGVINPPLQSVAGSGSKTDSNGNTITASASSPQTFTDTLGSTALTISGAAPNPVSYTYKNAAGTSVSVTIYYTAYTVKTNFGATSGGNPIAEYGPTSFALVDHIILPNAKQYSFTYEQTPGSCTPLSGTYQGYCVTARIASVTLPTGGQITYTYTGGSNGITSDGSAAGLQRTVSTGAGWTATWQYVRAQVSGTHWTTTITDPTTPNANQTVIHFQGIYETQRQSYQGSSPLLQTINTCYNGSAIPCTNTAVTLPISRRTVNIQPDSGTIQSKNDTFFNSYGLPTETDEYDFHSSSPPLVRKTLITYASLGNNILDRPATITVCTASGTSPSCGGTGTQIAQTTITYDEGTVTATSGVPQHGAVSGSRGNPTTVKQWISGTTYATSTITYYDTGNVLVAKDPGLHQTTFSYSDSWGDASCPPPPGTQAYPTQITNQLSQNTQVKYYQCTGQPYSVRDPNDIALNRDGAKFTYGDDLSRLTQTDFGDGGRTTIAYQDTLRTITTTQKQIGTATISETDQFDQLGRLVQRQLPGGRKVDTTYDVLGRVWTQSNPYVSISDSTYGLVETQYDALSRVKKLIRQDTTSTVLVDYSNNEVKVTDETGKKRLALTDGLGRVTKVCEVTAGNTRSPNESCGLTGFTESGYVTVNTYNVLDKITQIVQGTAAPQQQTRTMAYDGLGRITSATIPEVSTATSVTYGYDLDSNRTNVTDPRGVVNLEYDALHRPIRKKHGTTIVAEYTFDGTAGNNAIGRLITETDGAAGSGADKSDYTFDPLGRVKSANRTVSGIAFNLGYQYDLMGSLTQLTFPSGRVMKYFYNSAAELTQARDATTAQEYDYVASAAYSPLGTLQQLNFGSQVSTSLGWNNLARLTSIMTQKVPAPALLSLGYTYYANGQIQQIVNNLVTDGTQDEKYTYDDLQRLFTAQRGPDTNIQRKYSYDYDRFGNRWAQTVTGGSGLPGTNTFDYGNNKVTSPNFSFDASGNLTANGSLSSFTYNQENFMTAAGASVSYVYDAEGRKVRKTVGSTVTDYFYAGTELLSEKQGASWTDYIFFGGQRIAKQTGSTAASAVYLHTDHLRSTRVCTDANGISNGTCDYEPYGEIQPGSSCSVPTNFRFAGMEWDADAGPNGLYHTLFRQYDPNQGRWMSVDPLRGTPDDPQSLDRYAYVMNDPLNLTDPSGLYPDTDILKNDTYPNWGGFCAHGGLGIGGMGPMGDTPAGPPPAPSPASGSSLGGETLGVPNSIHITPTDIWGLLIPTDTGCDFGACGSVSQGFQISVPAPSPWWWTVGRVASRAIGATVALVIALLSQSGHGYAYHAVASCPVHQIGTPNHAAVGMVQGEGWGNSEAAAKAAAYADATGRMKASFGERGFHLQHCHYRTTRN